MSLFILLTLGMCFMLSHCSPSGEHLGSPYFKDAFEEAKTIVDEAYKYSREESLRRVRRENVSPSDILRLMKQPRGDARQAVRSADYMAQTLRLLHNKVHHVHKRSLNATDLLSPEQLTMLSEITGCSARVRNPQCRTIQNVNTFRTATSVCNNLRNPRLGASNTPFARVLPAQYDDGVFLTRGSKNRINNVVLPLVREVSNRILSTLDRNVVSDRENTLMTTFFGQWNDHDLSFTPFSPSIRSFSNGVDCEESCEHEEPCIPIVFPRNDPRRPFPREGCLPSFRSAPACGTGTSAFNFGGEPNRREQINTLTAFLDLGQVYGSEEQLATRLRDLTNDGGLLRVNPTRSCGRELLPFDTMNANMCATRRNITRDRNAREVPCFIAGDSRVNENFYLTSIHTLFLREHNRLARALRRMNPHWDGERLYQEARKINGAYTQVFVFRDYLLHILGPNEIRKLSRYPGYNPNVDPSITNVFATAAYRFAHNTLQPVLPRLDANYKEAKVRNVPLFLAFFTPWRIVFEGGIDPVLRGMIRSPAKLNTQDNMMVTAVRDQLFKLIMDVALDLGALNMARGRDHGLPGYNAWRRACGLSQPQNEYQLGQVLGNRKLARNLIQLYGTPANIDVWLGGVAEPFSKDARVGPLFACLIRRQFQAIRQGDRLWYENPGVFTTAQIAELRRVTLARIICDNTGIRTVPQDVFTVRSRLVNCNSIPRLNLERWRERPGQGDNDDEFEGEGEGEIETEDAWNQDEEANHMDTMDPENELVGQDDQELQDNEIETEDAWNQDEDASQVDTMDPENELVREIYQELNEIETKAAWNQDEEANQVDTMDPENELVGEDYQELQDNEVIIN